MESPPIATPGFCARIEENASISFPIEVVDEHLFEVGVTRSTVTNELPFGVDDDFFVQWTDQDEVGFDQSGVPKFLGVLVGHLVA